MKSRNISALLNHCEIEPVRFIFNKYWSDCLYICRHMTSHGVIFPKVPVFQTLSLDSYLIYIIFGLLCRIEKVWRSVFLVDLQTSNWNGWIFMYITRFFFSQEERRQYPNDPFKLIYVSTIDFFHEKVDLANISEYFDDPEKCVFLRCSTGL